MLGTIKKTVLNGMAIGERALLAPAPLPFRVLASRIVLVGASVAELWHVEVRYPCITVRALYDFDKTPVLDGLLAERPPPDAVILKQCAAYFPGPVEPRRALVTGWIDRLERSEVVPILATVVPVTRAHERTCPGRLEGLLEHNRWTRQLAADRGLAVLDLEAALRLGPEDPSLDPRLATRDGLHLRHRAYRRRLDPIVAPALVEAFSAT